MRYMLQLGTILSVSFAGELLRRLLPLPVPASVYGLCLLLVLLCTGVVKADFIRPTANLLIELMPLMFVPATVGVMQSWGVLKTALIPFILAVTVITFIVMAATALIVQKLEGGAKNDRIPQ